MVNGKAMTKQSTGTKPLHFCAKILTALLVVSSLSGCFDNGKKSLFAGSTGGSTGGSGSPTSHTPTPTGNQAPTIGGSPSTVAKSSLTYEFQPTARDPDGDALTFQVQNLPSWATFDPKTGKITGTPNDAALGTYANIEIIVSDGKNQAALPPFTITVSPPVIGSTTLSWEPSPLNEDGSPLTDLAGYVVRYGKDPANLDQKIDLNNPGVTSVVVDSLIEGTWYFTVASVNSSGVESRPTGYAMVTIG